MAAGSTYTPIATTTIGTATNSYTFSSISGTYTDLVLVCSIKGSATAAATFQLNGDTASNYSNTILRADGTTASSARQSNTDRCLICNSGYVTTGDYATFITQFMNYSNTTTYKTALSRSASASVGLDAIVDLWRSTAAITSIKVMLDTGVNISVGSTLTLYGIAAA